MNIKLNNKGMSLVELLIAIAIAAVVSLLITTMMTSSTSMFRKESAKIDAQNDMQIVQNQLADILREAKEINILRGDDGSIRIYTGPVNTTTNQLAIESTTETDYTDSIITYKDNTIYVTSKYMENIPDGYVLSKNVTYFDINIGNDPITYTEQQEDAAGNIVTVTNKYYNNPVTLDINMTIKSGKNEKDADMTVQVRNKLEKFYIYRASSINQYMSGAWPFYYELR